MANALFNPGREGFLDGTIRWDGTAVVKAGLVKTYTFAAANKFVSDLTTAGGVFHTTAARVALTTQTKVDGIADAADTLFSAVVADAANYSVVLYQASLVTGGADVAATAQRLIAWIDTGTNFPIIPNGGDVTIAWDNTANRIFKL
jgi:hypothetical protein